MYKKLKNIVISAMFALLMFSVNTAAETSVIINGIAVNSDVAPYIVDGRTMVPLRVISEGMGANVDYDADLQSISVFKEDVDIYLTIGSENAEVNGEEITIDVLPEITDGRTMVPLRFIAESFGCDVDYDAETKIVSIKTGVSDEVPPFDGSPYAVLNNNLPLFLPSEYTTECFECYSDLDELGRPGRAFACVGIALMPTEEREGIGMIKPAGWHTVKYDIIDGKYLYNRCHLIGYQLSGENANEKNLITGTRYMNVDGMLPFENTVAEYVQSTDNHVLYRATPVYDDDDLLAKGVVLEAFSIEDMGDGVCFNVFVYNEQPGIEIDHSTGESQLTQPIEPVLELPTEITTFSLPEPVPDDIQVYDYILNTNTKKFHYPDCKAVGDMSDKNKQGFNGSREEAIELGYIPCGICRP